MRKSGLACLCSREAPLPYVFVRGEATPGIYRDGEEVLATGKTSAATAVGARAEKLEIWSDHSTRRQRRSIMPIVRTFP